KELLDRMTPYAELLDRAFGGTQHISALSAQQTKIADPENTPSGALLRLLRNEGISLHDYTLRSSQAHRDALLATQLPPSKEEAYVKAAADSLQAQADLEQSDTESFSAYVARYQAGLKRPSTV